MDILPLLEKMYIGGVILTFDLPVIVCGLSIINGIAEGLGSMCHDLPHPVWSEEKNSGRGTLTVEKMCTCTDAE